MGQNLIQNIRINSISDNNKFEINSIKILYSLPENSFTLINDEQNNIYLAKVDKFQKSSDTKEDEIKKYMVNTIQIWKIVCYNHTINI